MLNLCVVHHPPLLHESVEAKVLTPVSFKKMGSYTLPSQMRAFLLDMRAHIEREQDRSWIVNLIRKKFTPRQLNVIVNPSDILPYKIPYTRANWDQFEELVEDILEMSQSKDKYESMVHEFVEGYSKELTSEQQQRVKDIMNGAFPSIDRPSRVKRARQLGQYLERGTSPYYSAAGIEYQDQKRLATDEKLKDMLIPLQICGLALAHVRLFKEVVVGSLEGFLYVSENLLRAKCASLANIKGEMYQTKPYRMPLDVETMVVALMYYVQEFARLGKSVPKPQSLEHASDEELIGRPYKRTDLLLALENAEIRRKFCKDSLIWQDRLPETFTPNCGQFRLWEEKLVDYLNHLPGSSGVPLSYVIRDDNIIRVLNAQDHLHSLILLAPHYGSYYIKDTTDVYNIIMKCVPRETIDDCTNNESCFGDGRLMMQRLRTVYEKDVGGVAGKLKMDDLPPSRV
jgi:hypothetical protein